MNKTSKHERDAPVDMERRNFLKISAGVTFAIGAGGLIVACSQDSTSSAVATPNAAPLAASIWVTIYPDERIKLMYGGTEMGQGSMTATPLVLAEHLDADWNNVTVETVAVHDKAYGNPFFGNILYTAGSTNVAAYFDLMRTAGTQVRKMLLTAAADNLGVAVGELTTETGTVLHKPSGQTLSYGEIVQQGNFPGQLPAVDASEFKAQDEYRYLGTDVQRIDVPSKVDGSARYGMDVQVPGMVYAAIFRSPVEGESPLGIDDSQARGVNGVIEIVRLPYGVAVVGETVEATFWGKQKLKIKWSGDSQLRSANTGDSIKQYEKQARDLSTEATSWNANGNIQDAFEHAVEIVEAAYTSEPVYHAQMEPLNATASVSDDGKFAEIWVGTQTQSFSIIGAAQALETDPGNIKLHPLTLGGGYGRRSLFRQQYIDDALFVSREIKKPVKVIWSREDDMEAGVFRTAAAQFLRAAFDREGNLTGFHHRVAAPSILETMNPGRWKVAQGKDVITMLGSENTTYDIPNFLAEHVLTERSSRVCAWRGVGTSYTKFAIESFIDELALLHDRDPLEFRLSHCQKNPRMHKVLETVAEMADWGRIREDSMLGLAAAGYHKSLAAGVVELSVDRETGEIDIRKFWAVGDPGYVVSPANAEAQLEGNIVFGLSAALKERIEVVGGEVQQTNFHQYPILRMSEVPEIELRVLSTDHPPSGVGELGLAMVAPAINNAITRMTGARIRHLPLTPDVVRGAFLA